MQQISRNIMDIYFGYNGRVGDVNGAKNDIQEYEQMSKSAATPEERERYAQAAQKVKNQILPQMQKEMEELGKQLGLKSGQLGNVIKKEDLLVADISIKQERSGILSMVTAYEPGSYYSDKT